MPAGARAVRVSLKDWQGSVAIVLLDGKEVGWLGWQPYEARFAATPGKHVTQVKVVATPRNTMGPFHSPTKPRMRAWPPLGPTFHRSNVLEVEVTSTAANRVRDLDRRKVAWKNFYDINFVNLDCKPFDASSWPVAAAGLLGHVQLTRLAPVAQTSPRHWFFLPHVPGARHQA